MCVSLEANRNTLWFVDLTLQVRRRFTGKDELHSNTSQPELRIPLCLPKDQQDLVRCERFTNKNPIHNCQLAP
ncbi:hypothetical protein AVEN_273145-1, partial [Araneus ventricosus]